jgi:TolB protein
VIRLPDWTAHVQVIEVFGGQGTLNVNSWAPDGERFAYVSYPLSSP